MKFLQKLTRKVLRWVNICKLFYCNLLWFLVGTDPKGKAQADFDVVAANRMDKKIILGECKWKNSIARINVVDLFLPLVKYRRNSFIRYLQLVKMIYKTVNEEYYKGRIEGFCPPFSQGED